MWSDILDVYKCKRIEATILFSNISPDIGVVNTVAIHILVTDSADTVTALTLKIFV